MSAYYKSDIAEGESLALRQQAVESQTLAFRKVNDIEIVLMRLQPGVGVIRNTGRPRGVNSWLVSHRQRNPPYALFLLVILNPVNHVAVGGMTSEEEEYSHVVAGPFQRVGETGVRSADPSVARRPLDFPRRYAHTWKAGAGGNFKFGEWRKRDTHFFFLSFDAGATANDWLTCRIDR